MKMNSNIILEVEYKKTNNNTTKLARIKWTLFIYLTDDTSRARVC
jgi:hypothetical protein